MAQFLFADDWMIFCAAERGSLSFIRDMLVCLSSYRALGLMWGGVLYLWLVWMLVRLMSWPSLWGSL